MNIAVYLGKEDYRDNPAVGDLVTRLRDGGCILYYVAGASDLQDGTDMLLSVGGDGTFLSSAAIVSDSAIPVLGVNLGRLGFLSENRPEDVAGAVLKSDYMIEERAILKIIPEPEGLLPFDETFALNEVSVHRSGSSMLEVEASIDGTTLPSYWADGLVVSTSSGSTAYSLSVGGPIVLPEAKVLIIAPIAPHNLNVRPLVVPDTSKISLKMYSRDEDFILSSDNRSFKMKTGSILNVSVAQFSLKRVRLNQSNFIKALTQKLFWGEDVRNIK